MISSRFKLSFVTDKLYFLETQLNIETWLKSCTLKIITFRINSSSQTTLL